MHSHRHCCDSTVIHVDSDNQINLWHRLRVMLLCGCQDTHNTWKTVRRTNNKKMNKTSNKFNHFKSFQILNTNDRESNGGGHAILNCDENQTNDRQIVQKHGKQT